MFRIQFIIVWFISMIRCTVHVLRDYTGIH